MNAICSTLAHVVLVVSIVCMSAIASAQSEQQNHFFNANVAVQGQSADERQQAAQQGLMDVLVRISGSEAVRDNEILIKQSRSAIRYVQQFAYLAQDDAELLSEGMTYQLQLSFSPSMIRQLLAEAKVPFWPVNRAAVLVWLVEDHPEYGRQLVPADSMDLPAAQALAKASAYRGLPLSFPLLDFEDQTGISVDELWSLDQQAIVSASERYRVSLILVGKLSSTSDGQIISSWQFFNGERSRSYDLRAPDLDQTMRAGIAPLVDYLAENFALNSDAVSFYTLQLDGIRSFADYRAAMDLLSALDAVSDLVVLSTDAEQLTLRLVSEASREQMIRTLSMDSRLEQLESESAAYTAQEAGTLRYRWLP